MDPNSSYSSLWKWFQDISIFLFMTSDKIPIHSKGQDESLFYTTHLIPVACSTEM